MQNIHSEGFTVGSLLEVPSLKDAVLVGGNVGLNNVITKVNIMEMPELAEWASTGEVVMTTSNLFRENPEQLVLLIEQLAAKGIAALGVKPKPLFSELSPQVIEVANQLGLPLIELPSNIAITDLVHEIMERMLATEAKSLMILQSRVQKLSQVLLNGGNIERFMTHLYEMINNPVLLIEDDGGSIAPPELDSLNHLVIDSEWFKAHGAKRIDNAVITINEKVFPIHSFHISGDSGYQLVVVEQHSSLCTVDTLTLNWATRLLEFEINNMQVRKNIEAKYLEHFVQDWMIGKIPSKQDLQRRAEACGWLLQCNSAYMVGSVSFWKEKPNNKELQHIAKQLNSNITYLLDANIFWTILEDELVCLISHQGGRWKEQQYKELTKQMIHCLTKQINHRQVTLCVSKVVSMATEVEAAYRETKRVMEIRKVYRSEEDVLHYNELGVYLLLYRMQGTSELEEFKQIYLYPLLELERKQQGALLMTLATYFACNCNAKETAQKLYVHYNTVNYRLERIRDELQLRLDDPEVKLLLQLAIKTYHMQQQQ